MKGSVWSDKRKSVKRRIKIHDLLVTNGEQTEINYFKKLSEEIRIKLKTAPSDSIQFDFKFVKGDPLVVQGEAIRIYEEAKRNNLFYNNVWLIFDKDDFTSFSFNQAILRTEKYSVGKGVQFCCLWSNQCIELWFLLHFIKLSTNIARKEYFKKLSKILNVKYEKNEKELVELFEKNGGELGKAVKYANQLLTEHKDKSYAKKVPATNVVKFFEHYSKVF